MEGTPEGRAKEGGEGAPSDNSGNRPCLYKWGMQHWFNRVVNQWDQLSNRGFVGSVFATKLAKPVNEQP